LVQLSASCFLSAHHILDSEHIHPIMSNHSMLACCVVLATLSAVVTATTSGLRQQGSSQQAQAQDNIGKKATQHHTVLAQSPEAKDQLLTICNAYASAKSLEIMKVQTRQSLTEGKPLSYKQCKDFTLPLEEGEQLDFLAGGVDVGTFYATGLPKTASSLLLIPHRRSPHSVGLSFESHAFAELQTPQIAVIDAYRSSSKQHNGVIKIMENLPPATGKPQTAALAEVEEEELKFNSVVAVNAGKYMISLTGKSGTNATKMALNAAGKVKYVIMSVGNEGEVAGGHYPQELVVFPNSALRTSTQLSIYLFAIAAVFFVRCDAA